MYTNILKRSAVSITKAHCEGKNNPQQISGKSCPILHLISVAQIALQTKKTQQPKKPQHKTHPLPKLPLTSVLFKTICSV